jgi:energy-coupling factor transporter ATP-binding protein EcfA2
VTRLVEITDLGIHREFLLPLVRGKVVEIVGPNGIGKTTAIDAVREWLDGDVKVQRRDGTDKGQLTCDGSGIRRFAKQRRSFGNGPREMGFVFVEDHFKLDDLIEGGKFKEVEERDARRIKAQLTLSRAKIEWSEFEKLVPPKNGHDPISSDKARTEDDPVRQAAVVKKIFEAEARKFEDLANQLRADQRVAVESVKDVDVEQPHDRSVLQQSHEAAVTRLATLREQAKAAETAKRLRADAEVKIQEAGTTYRGPTVQEATAALQVSQTAADLASSEKQAADEAVRAAEEALRNAKGVAASKAAIATAAQSSVASARQTLQAAQDHDSLLAQLTGQFAADLPQPPDAAEVLAAETAKAAAERAVFAGEQVRTALAKRTEAEGLGKKAAANESWATRLRDAGKATDEVLSKALKSPRLRVLGDRLLYLHDDGREEEFDRLSRGQRSIAAIQEAAKGVTEEGDGTRVLLFPQEVWEGLDPESRDSVADVAALEDLCVVTGRVHVRGEPKELHVIVYGEGVWEPSAELSA